MKEEAMFKLFLIALICSLLSSCLVFRPVTYDRKGPAGPYDMAEITLLEW